jgi:hypothetical protein
MLRDRDATVTVFFGGERRRNTARLSFSFPSRPQPATTRGRPDA